MPSAETFTQRVNIEKEGRNKIVARIIDFQPIPTLKRHKILS